MVSASKENVGIDAFAAMSAGKALKPYGALGIVGASPGEITVPVFDLLEGQKSIGGSAVGSNSEMKEMFTSPRNTRSGRRSSFTR